MTSPRIVWTPDTGRQQVESISAELKGQPYLKVSTTSRYTWVYDDSGTGSDMDLTVFRPTPDSEQTFIIGDCAQSSGTAQGFSLTVQAINDSSDYPLLKAPIGYAQVWNDHGSGGRHDGSIWLPMAPDGYIAIGAVASDGYTTPNIPSYRCLRRDLLVEAQPGALIWNDRGSGAHDDVALYSIMGLNNAFLAQANYSALTGTYYTIRNI
ncbi:MAG: Vps62-related protein [Pseudomonadota bacterium]